MNSTPKRRKRTYHRRLKTDHVICVNCNAVLKLGQGQNISRQRYPLTNRLQDRRWDPSKKPGVSVLEGLMEIIPELAGEYVKHYLSPMHVCHECFILLRQVVNYKFKVQTRLIEFQKQITDVTNAMRIETNRQAKKTGKMTKCWVCNKNFPQYVTKYGLNRRIVNELTVKEAIESVLPEESSGLQECSERYTMICEGCFNKLNKIIKVQCSAETTRMSFMERTNERGLLSKIQECGNDLDRLDDYILDGASVDDNDKDIGGEDDNDNDEDNYKDTGEDDQNLDDTLDERLNVDVAEPSGNIIVISAETVHANEGVTNDSPMENLEIQSTDVQNDSRTEVGRKRKLSQSDFEASIEEPSEVNSEESFQEHFDAFAEQEDYIGENEDETENKRRKTNAIDTLLSLRTASIHSEEALQIDETMDIESGDIERGVAEEEKATLKEATLKENTFKKIVYYLQKNSVHKVFKILKKNCVDFEGEIQNLVRDYVRKETARSSNLEKSYWSNLSLLHSGSVTIDSFIRVFEEQMPLISSVLTCSISGQKELEHIKLEKKQLLRLLTLMGIIAYERNPDCNVLQCLNSIQMAEDGCTSELYNTFYGLGLCLKEPQTQALLARPDYSQHQVCWGLLKEAQERIGSTSRTVNKDRVQDTESVSDDDYSDDDNLPDDFPVVCPYFKSPPLKTALAEKSTASAEWMLYTDPTDPGAADMVRLIFAEAGMTYQECTDPFDSIEVIGGKQLEYPVMCPPVVKKGSLTLSQVPVICRHLGEVFGLCPESLEDRLHAEQICQACHDLLQKDSLPSQTSGRVRKELTALLQEDFIQSKIPRFLTYLESALEANNSYSGYFFGNQLSYVDIVVFQTLRTIGQQFPWVLKQTTEFSQIQTFRETLSQRGNIKTFMESRDRKIKEL